jgi:hypothetical protein
VTELTGLPSPPAVTSSPFDQPVTFTLQVLLDLGQMTTSATVIVPAQEHFSSACLSPIFLARATPRFASRSERSQRSSS